LTLIAGKIRVKTKHPFWGILYLFWARETKTGQFAFWLLFKIGLCSATSMESSRRHLLNDVAELRSMLKNNENTFYPRFSVTRKTGVAFPKTGVLFFTLKAI